MTRPTFKPGPNIAVKIPSHEYDKTVCFYRDILGLSPLAECAPHLVFEFGGKRLWLDRAEALSQAEIWLEVTTADLDAAVAYLAEQGVDRRDEIERLPQDFRGFWITNAAGIIHLVTLSE